MILRRQFQRRRVDSSGHLGGPGRQVRSNGQRSGVGRSFGVARGGQVELDLTHQVKRSGLKIGGSLLAGRDADLLCRRTSQLRGPMQAETHLKHSVFSSVVTQRDGDLQLLLQRQESRKSRHEDEWRSNSRDLAGGTEVRLFTGYGHHPQGSLKVGHLEGGPGSPPAVGSNHAGPERDGLSPAQALGSDHLRLRQAIRSSAHQRNVLHWYIG